jgi:hypothetical protein
LVNHGNEKKAYALSDKEYKFKGRTGRATDKEQLTEMLKTCYKKANSKDDFFDNLKESGLSTYVRGGRISGVIFKNKKFRLNRLGFTDERLQELERTFNRTKELNGKREGAKGKNIRQRR